MTNLSALRRYFVAILAWGTVGTFLALRLARSQGRATEFDAWDVVQVKGQRVGYAHTTLCLVAGESGRQVAKVSQSHQVQPARSGQETGMEMDYRDTETPDGR